MDARSVDRTREGRPGSSEIARQVSAMRKWSDRTHQMTDRTPLPRVFVSSVIDGFESVRRCAREAIKRAGGEPVLVEDFHTQDVTARNACLDGVASCDACITIIGSRGGHVAPSGKVVVEEEYDEAKRRKLPTLFYLQEVEHDEAASALANRLSGYIDGQLRATFTTTEDLRSLFDRNLPPLIENLRMQQTDRRDLQRLLADPASGNRGTALLRTVVASERREEIEELVDPSKLKELNILALQCDLFAIEPATEHRVGANSLTLIQSGGRGGYKMLDSVALHENGVVVVESALEDRDGSSSAMIDMLSHMIVNADQMEERMSAALRFVFTVFEKFDPYARYGRFLYNTIILNYDGKLVERNPQPRPHGLTMPMYSTTDGILAYDELKVASRADLASPEDMTTRAVDRIIRRLNASNSNRPSC